MRTVGQIVRLYRWRSTMLLAILTAIVLSPAVVACNSDQVEIETVQAPFTPTPMPTEVSEFEGITPEEVLFGQSAAFSGPARELGLNMRLGIEAAFAEVNQQGGVFGRQLSLISLDDTYET